MRTRSTLARAVAAIAAISLAAGCLPIPQRLADMPEMSGRVRRGGEPVAGLEIAFYLNREGTGCTDGRTTTTDSAGAFHFPPTYETLPFTMLAPPNGYGSWTVCARTPAGKWAAIYTNRGYRGTTERIDCAIEPDATGACRTSSPVPPATSATSATSA